MSAFRRVNGNTESVDNYLKAILYLGGSEGSRVSIKALALRLRVAPSSVTNMLQKLAAALTPMVEYERHRGVSLSSAGKRRALEVLRHHRLIETFLFEVLDYPVDEVHDEAERLEHFISERFEERIAAKMGHPRIDPHGRLIPTMEGEMPETPSRGALQLADLIENGTLVMNRPTR
jgi:DtxR family Mn-dependent transcriptional regulator